MRGYDEWKLQESPSGGYGDEEPTDEEAPFYEDDGPEEEIY